MTSPRTIALLVLITVAACATTTPSEIRRRETPRLIADLTAEESWIREEAARALGERQAAESRAALEARVADAAERSWVRAAAADALGALAAPESLAVLIGATAEAGAAPELKLSLIGALCRYATRPEALRAIGELRDDTDLLVSAAAEKRLVTRCGS